MILCVDGRSMDLYIVPVAPYGYLPPTVYLFMSDIANPDLFVCG